MEQIKRIRIIKKALFTFILATGLMFVFEFSKQSVFPLITIWDSHIITIFFVSILSSILSYYIYLSFAYKKLYRKELSIRKKHEKELIYINKNQEKTIAKRTGALLEVNNQLQQAKIEAEESNKLKSVFLQNISHEIRTPLNAIMGFSQLIKQDKIERNKIETYSNIIIDRGNDLLELVDEILMASRLEVGKMPVTIETFSLHTFLLDIKNVFENLQIRFKKDDLEFVFQFVCSEDTLITTDKTKLQFIFSNLISNAFKFTNKGRIEIGCNRITDDQFVFYVSDTGIGIDENMYNQIFDKFTQVDNSMSNTIGGFGLGLSIVKGFVELLNGTITVRSIKGEGSVFTFTIPNKHTLVQ